MNDFQTERPRTSAVKRELKVTIGEKVIKERAPSFIYSFKFPDADKLHPKIPKDPANTSTEELHVML